MVTTFSHFEEGSLTDFLLNFIGFFVHTTSYIKPFKYDPTSWYQNLHRFEKIGDEAADRNKHLQIMCWLLPITKLWRIKSINSGYLYKNLQQMLCLPMYFVTQSTRDPFFITPAASLPAQQSSFCQTEEK